MPNKIADHLARRTELKEELKKHNIMTDNLENLMNTIAEDSVLQNQILNARTSQFDDDAYDLLMNFKNYTYKNQEQVARFLRKFAEHVTSNTQEIVFVIRNMDQETMSPADIVDRIPQMSKEEEK